MTSRERVLAAVNHKEPDRVPIDIGSTIMSGIMAHALDRLRKHLGLEGRLVKVYEVYQMLGEVEFDVIDRFGIDVLPVEPPVQFFGLRRENYKPWKLFDGTEVAMPGQFDVEINEKGDWLIHDEGNPANPVVGKMPKDGYYFDKEDQLRSVGDFEPPALEDVRKENQFTTEDLEFLAARAERLRKETDKALLLGAWGKFGLGIVGSIPDFLMLLVLDKGYIKDLFEVRTETALSNMEKAKRYLGDNIDIIGIDGFDYGSQKTEMFDPALFEELFVPGFTAQNRWVHENTPWKTWQHTCGSVVRILPMLVESGLDIFNPVQLSAGGMDARELKDKYGDRLTFWGGGVDTQRTLPFGTPEEVRAEVKERLEIFAPGGGFVFNPIHNVQQATPPENLIAALDTVLEHGKYPVKA